MTYTLEEWERRAAASQDWADRARPLAEGHHRDRMWFTALAVLFVLGTLVATLIVAAPLARGAGGCRTKACEERVWNRTHPFRPALASWYDGIGLGGKTACLGYRSPGWWRSNPTVAHKTLPCGTRLRVCYRRCMTVEVWDRGPFSGAREFDLDRRVRDATGFNGVAVIRVRELPR